MTSLQPSNGCGKTSGKQKKVISAVLQALFFQKSLSENLPISGLYIRTGGRWLYIRTGYSTRVCQLLQHNAQ